MVAELRFDFLQPSVADLAFANIQEKSSASAKGYDLKSLERLEILFEVLLLKSQRQISPNLVRAAYGLFLRQFTNKVTLILC